MTDGTETSTVLNNQEQSAFEGLRVEFEAMIDWERTTLTETERKSMLSLLWEYRDSFSKGAQDVGRADLVEHQIPTADANPVKQAPRRVPHALRPVVEEQVESMLRSEIIRPSTSPWASPIVLVKKKDGAYRFCIDYRKVNSLTVKDSFPLPRIDDTLDVLGGPTSLKPLT